MTKRWFPVGVMLLLASLLVVGCGVPQEELDAALADAAAVKSELVSAQSDLSKVKSDLAAAESELETLQADLDKAKSDLSAAQGQVSSLKSERDKAKSDLAAAEEQIAELEAAAAPPEEEVVEEEVVEEEAVPAGVYGYEYPEELSFTPVDVTVEEYGFSFQHPDYWFLGEGEEGTINYLIQDAAAENGLWLWLAPVADADTFEAVLTTNDFLVDLEIFNVWETTLADGTTAYVADFNASIGGWVCSQFAIGVPHGDYWIIIFTWHSPPGEYDQALDAEIVHTLTLQ